MMPVSLCMGDLDGDTDLDITILSGDYFVSGNTEIQIFENIQNGITFQTLPIIYCDITRGAVLIHNYDLDTDGDLDLVFNNNNGKGLYILENIGDLDFGPLQSFAPSRFNDYFEVGDISGDGQLDIVSVGTGISLAQNITPVPGRNLVLQPLIHGQQSSVEISGFNPGELVRFLYSKHGWGNSFGIPGLGGIVLDLVDPINLLGSDTVDENGLAHLDFMVPANAPQIDIVMQALVQRGLNGQDSIKSKFIIAAIQ